MIFLFFRNQIPNQIRVDLMYLSVTRVCVCVFVYCRFFSTAVLVTEVGSLRRSRVFKMGS